MDLVEEGEEEVVVDLVVAVEVVLGGQEGLARG